MEYENSTAGESEVSLAPIVGYLFGDNKIDFMAQLSQEQSGNRPFNGKLELRYKRSFSGPFGFNPKIRVSVGEKLNENSEGGNFPYFTLQPFLSKEIGAVEWYISYRYRNAFDSSNLFESHTAYFGGEFGIAKGWVIEPSYFHKWSDGDQANGVELQIARTF